MNDDNEIRIPDLSAVKRLIPSLLALGTLILIVMFVVGFLHRTGSTDVGVRTVKFSLIPGQIGVQDNYYAPGAMYFFPPYFNDWHTFDTKLQNLEMTIASDTGDLRTRDDLLFKTIDGNDISLDIIVSYRLIPEMAPHVLQYIAKDDLDLRHKIVRAIVRSRPRDIFGELTTEEFYDASTRAAKSETAKTMLNEILEPYGVIVEKVLTKDYRFNEAYQKAIEDKKVADQRTQQNISATRAAREEYLKKLQEAQGTLNEMVAVADGEFRMAKITADAYFEQQAKIAEAIQIEGEATAEGIFKMNEALAGAGGETMVKLAIAEALQGKKIVLIPVSGGDAGGLSLKTTDVNDLLRTYGLLKASGQGKTGGK
jgi:regulator of protease activity HflC (stomatin/prohibitin superfamily)